MFCIECGKNIEPSIKFCGSCGADHSFFLTSKTNLDLIKCTSCNQYMAKSADECPHCGSLDRIKGGSIKSAILGLIAVAVFIFFIFPMILQEEKDAALKKAAMDFQLQLLKGR